MRWPSILSTLALMSAASVALAAEALPVDSSWARSPVWDDGLAEVAHYEAHRKVYSVDRGYETILITVKEDLDRARAVKADAPYEGRDLISVLKLNIISHIQTENYPYNYMTSVFVRRDDPRALVKLAGSSQEWCGTTFMEVVTWDGAPRLEFHSYFDGQADGAYPMDLGGGALLEEQLFLVMRGADLMPGKKYPLQVYDSLIANRARRPSSHAMVVSLQGEEELKTPAGAFTTRRIEVKPAAQGATGPAPGATFWIEKGANRTLVRFESTDGRTLLLNGISRRDYWTRR